MKLLGTRIQKIFTLLMSIALTLSCYAQWEGKDTITLTSNLIVKEYYEDTGDWFLAIEDGDYTVRLDYVSPTMTGTYTEADLDMKYSFIVIDQGSYNSHVDYLKVHFTVSDNEQGTDVQARILGTDSILYLVHAHEDPMPTPKDTIALAYTSAELIDATAESGLMYFFAEENGYTTSLFLIADQVEGIYHRYHLYNAHYNYIIYQTDTDSAYIDILDFYAEVTREGRSFLLQADVLGADTILYQITMPYHLPLPIDTIDIVAHNLEIVEQQYWGAYFTTIAASNDDYEVWLECNRAITPGEYTYLDFDIAWCYVKNLNHESAVGINDVQATVSSNNGLITIQAEVMGVDTIVYHMELHQPSVETAIECVTNTSYTTKAIKRFENQRIVIYHEEKKYGVLGNPCL